MAFLISVTLFLLIVIGVIYLLYFQWSVSVPDFMAARHYRFGKPTTDGPISGRRVFVIPSIDQLVMIDTRIQKSSLENISVITKERQVMNLSVTLIWKAINAAMTIESIRSEDIEPTFFKIAESVIKSESSKMSVDELLENRTVLSKNLLKTLTETTDNWGISVSSINISNLAVVNESFMRNMALPKEIELERKSKIAQIEKDLAIELRTIEKSKESELSQLESEKIVGIKKEEIGTILERAQKDRQALILEMQVKLEQINSEISLIQENCKTTAESNKITANILAETEGLKEKLKVINSYSTNAINFELLRILPDLYKNITIGDVTLFEGIGPQNQGLDFCSYVAGSALSLMKKFEKQGGDSAEAYTNDSIIEDLVTE